LRIIVFKKNKKDLKFIIDLNKFNKFDKFNRIIIKKINDKKNNNDFKIIFFANIIKKYYFNIFKSLSDFI